MAKNSSYSIKEFWAEIPRENLDYLGSIRDWKDIQIAIEGDEVWLKGFSEEQTNSSEVLQLPNFVMYQLKEGLLFRKNALIPTKKMRTALLWHPIEKALKADLPISNNNFFLTEEKIDVKIIQSPEEKPSFGLLCSINEIEKHIAAIPNFKIEKLIWTIIGDQALIIGTPILSLPGTAVWNFGKHLLPTGCDFEFKNFGNLLAEKLSSETTKYILWNSNGNYLTISEDAFRPFSLSSFRLTLKSLEWS